MRGGNISGERETSVEDEYFSCKPLSTFLSTTHHLKPTHKLYRHGKLLNNPTKGHHWGLNRGYEAMKQCFSGSADFGRGRY